MGVFDKNGWLTKTFEHVPVANVVVAAVHAGIVYRCRVRHPKDTTFRSLLLSGGPISRICIFLLLATQKETCTVNGPPCWVKSVCLDALRLERVIP